MARNYRCPSCETGRRAPSRMKKGDIRRFCIPCSVESGFLVEMACPARDRRARDKAEARASRAKEERARERQAHILKDGGDRRRIIRRAKHLSTWAREGTLVKLAVEHTRMQFHEGTGGTSGHAKLRSRRVHVTVGAECSTLRFAVVVVHELAHIAAWAARRDRGHGQAFRGLLISSCAEFFGVPEEEIISRYDWPKSSRKLRAYEIDSAVVKVVRDILTAEGVAKRFAPKRSRTEVAR